MKYPEGITAIKRAALQKSVSPPSDTKSHWGGGE